MTFALTTFDLDCWRRYVSACHTWQATKDQYSKLPIDRVSVYRYYTGTVHLRRDAEYSLTWLPITDLQVLFPELILVTAYHAGSWVEERDALLRLPRAWVLPRLEATATPYLDDHTTIRGQRIFDLACYGSFWNLYLQFDWRMALRLSLRSLGSEDREVRDEAAADLEAFARIGVDRATASNVDLPAVEAKTFPSWPFPYVEPVSGDKAAWEETAAAQHRFRIVENELRFGHAGLSWGDLVGYALATDDGIDAVPYVLSWVSRTLLTPHYPALLQWASERELSIGVLRSAFSPDASTPDESGQRASSWIVRASQRLLQGGSAETYRQVLRLYRRWRAWEAILLGHAAATSTDEDIAQVGREFLESEGLPVPRYPLLPRDRGLPLVPK